MKLKKLKKNKKYLLACSFGPDSMALFSLLIKNKINFECAIVNYHLRNESDEEVNGLLNYANKYNIKVHVKSIFYNKNEGNEEAWARKERYSFFEELYKKENYEAVLIAHNLDDLLETYFLQKERDNYVSFYGLKEESHKNNVKYIRPLLNIRKKELQTYCDKNLIPYAIDKSNFDNSYKRNKLRNETIAYLNKKEIKIILKTINKNNKIKEKEEKKYKKIIINNKIYLKDIKNMNNEEFIKLFYFYLSLFPYIKNISKEFILDIKEKTALNKNIIQKIDNNYFVFIEYSYLKIDKIYEFKYSYNLTKVGNALFHFYENDKVNELFLKYDNIIVQNIDKNDFYLYKNKEKRVSKILIDMKLPISYRKIWPAIYSKDKKLLYIPRYQENIKESDKSILKFDLNLLINTYQNSIKNK